MVLKITPKTQNDRWVRWIQDVPPYVDQAFKDKAAEFSNLKIGYRGNLRFTEYEVLSVGDMLMGDEQEWERKAEQRKKEYIPQMRVEIQHIDSSAFDLPAKTRGTVEDVDSIGYIHVSWDNGRKIPINPDTDKFRVLTPEECFEERGEKMESDFIDGINSNVIPKIDMKKLGDSYDARDTAYPTEVLKMLHEQFVEA